MAIVGEIRIQENNFDHVLSDLMLENMIGIKLKSLPDASVVNPDVAKEGGGFERVNVSSNK